MSRVLVPSQALWYEELKAIAYYGESDLEHEIRQHVRSLFPDFYVFPFKSRIASQTTGQINVPDLAMVRRDFAKWAVIEIELTQHDIRHVLDQTRCFLEGNYNAPQIAEYIRKQLKTHCAKQVSLKRLRGLLATELPQVLVIADEETEHWKKTLTDKKVDLCVFQIFKNTLGEHIYLTCGGYPTVPARQAHCRHHISLNNVIEIVGDFDFKRLSPSKQLDVAINTTLTRWVLFYDQGKKYLRFLGKVNPLSPNATYILVADRLHNYFFQIT